MKSVGGQIEFEGEGTDGAWIDVPKGGPMPKRMILFVPAIIAIAVAAVASSSRSSGAADECIAKPSSAAPQGSRWYYRVDRASRRQCWFLAPEGVKARRAASLKRPPSASQTPPPTAEAPAETTIGETQLVTVFSTRWLELPISAGSIAREPAPMSNSYADEPATTHAQDDMPLVWPVLTPADLPAAERSREPTVEVGHMPFLTGALALAIMIGCAIFELSDARRRRRLGRSVPAADAIGPRKHVPSAFASTVAAAGRADSVRKSTAAMRRAGVARAPRKPSDPGCDIEENLRQLLHDWQRLAA